MLAAEDRPDHELEPASEQPYSVDEARAAIAEVVAEVHVAIEDDRFAVLRRDRLIAEVHAAAALAHCCHLAEHLVRSHRDGEEMVARLVARAMFESWVIGLYIHHGGVDAIEALWDDYHHELKTQVEHAQRHDDTLTRRRRKIRKKNEKIDARNEGVRDWNERNPHNEPKPLLPTEPEPPGVVLDYSDWEKRLETFESRPPQALPLMTIIDKLRTLTRAAGDEETFEAAYVMMFRGLSTVGAHTNIPVLQYYVDDRSGQATFVRARPAAVPPSSLEEPNLQTALLLVSHLSDKVLSRRGCPHPAADRIYEHFATLHAATGT